MTEPFSAHISTVSPIFHPRAWMISGGRATLALPPLRRIERLNFIVVM